MNGLICAETTSIVMVVVLLAIFVVVMIIGSVAKKKQKDTEDTFRPADPARVKHAMNYVVPTLGLLAIVLALVIMITALAGEYSKYFLGKYKAIAVVELIALIVAFATYYLGRKKEACYFVSLGALLIAVALSQYLPYVYDAVSEYIAYILWIILPALFLCVAVHYFVSSKLAGAPSPMTTRFAGFINAKGRTILKVLTVLATLLFFVNTILVLVEYNVKTIYLILGNALPLGFLILPIIAVFKKGNSDKDGELGSRRNYHLGAIYMTIAAALYAGFGSWIYYLGFISLILMIPAILLLISCYYVLPWQEDAEGAAAKAEVDTNALLADLNSLYASGIITKAEYEAEKEKLLLK